MNAKSIKKSCLTALLSLPLLASAQTSVNQKNIPDYSTILRKDIPAEYTWNTNDIYASQNAWKADKEQITKLIDGIVKNSKDWTSSAQKMLAMLELRDKVGLVATKLWGYASHQYNVDMGNTLFQSMKGELQSIFVQLGTKLAFMNPDIIALGSEKFKGYLETEPKLSTYRYGVEDVLRSKDHILPDEQQKIVSLTGLYSGVMSTTSSLLNDLEMPAPEIMIDTQKVTLNWANFVVYRTSKSQEVRHKVLLAFYENQKKFENTFAALLDGGIKADYFSAQVYKYPDCLTARLYGDSIPNSVYDTLVSLIDKNLTPLHRYLSLKKKLLKLTTYRYDDIYASAVPSVDKSYSFEEAKNIILKMTESLGKEYTDALKIAFANRWMDIYPNKGKESGAYSGDVYGIHPYIKLNYNGKYDAVSTMAHELGHSMHSYFADKNQEFVNAGYPTFLAEIASTFNENLLMHYFLKTETDNLFKLYILDSYLEEVRGTLYHQTMFAEFDRAMHRRVEEGKSLTSDWLDEEYLKLLRLYYGHNKNICEVGDYLQCGWSLIPHFYQDYYVFQYSTGITASLALSNMVMNGGEKERNQYLNLLKAGGNGYPLTLLKKAGVDMKTSAPYLAAIKQFNSLVNEMQALVDKLEKEGKI